VSVQALSWVLERSKSRLAARLVLLSIANHADSDGNKAWPSIPTIAREAHVSERQAQRAILDLCVLGELLVCLKGGPGQSNVYRIRMGGDKLSPGVVTNQTVGGDKSGDGVVTNQTVGGDKSGGAIRKNRPITVHTEPSLKQNQPPPTPLLQRGEFSQDASPQKRRRLNKAERRTLDNLAVNERVQARLHARFSPRGPCEEHPESGLTQWGTCWDCYAARYSSGPAPA
jgi:hypothetical protein